MTSRPTAGPPKKLLLATDLSARCDRALDRAAQLAAQWSAELIAVHASSEPSADAMLRSRHLRADSQTAAEERARQEIHAVAPGASVVVQVGDPADVVLRTAQARGCDLIVLGIARDEPLGRIFLGSTVESVLQRSKIPVLVVRRRAQRAYRTIVAATDFSDASRQAIGSAVAMFAPAGIRLLHAYQPPMDGMVTDPEPYRQQFEASIAKDGQAFLATLAPSVLAGLQSGIVLKYGEPTRVVGDYVNDNTIDLVVAGTRGRNALMQILVGSVAKQLVTTLDCDTLLIGAAPGSAVGTP